VERNRGKILVIRGGAIGDFILTLPAIRALRSTFPETHLEVLGYPVVAELAVRGGLIDGFRSIEARALAGFFARNAKLDPELSAYFESFSLIFFLPVRSGRNFSNKRFADNESAVYPGTPPAE